MPAELRIWRAYFSFSDLGVKNISINRLPSHCGITGLPEAPANRPSPVRSASLALNRIHALSSTTKAGLFICTVLAATMYSSTLSMAGRAVSSRTLTPSPVPACCNWRKSVGEMG